MLWPRKREMCHFKKKIVLCCFPQQDTFTWTYTCSAFFFSGVAVRKGPKCRISTTKKTIPKGWTESKETHTLPKIQSNNNKKKDPQKRLITGPQTERRRTGLYVHRALIREQDTDEGETEEEAISRWKHSGNQGKKQTGSKKYDKHTKKSN